MNVGDAGDVPLRRYRRRILGWGAVVVLGIYAGGAAVAEPGVEDDLEARVVELFNEAGVGPVTVSFDGQDGTLRCRSGPVEIDDDLLRRSRDLWGVESIDVDVTCTGTEQPAVTTTTTATTTPEPPATTVPASTTTVQVDTDDVGMVIANDSQFSTLSGLIRDSELEATFSAAGPITLFAPTNEAFQALGPDVVAALGRDPELLAAVLRHHATGTSVRVADIVDGEIEMLDGSPILATVTADGVGLASGSAAARIVEADLDASNGVVHAIDTVLLPDEAVTDVPAAGPLVTATWRDGLLTLSGTLASAEDRASVVAAAPAVDPANVDDGLDVDAASPVAAGDVAVFAELLTVAVAELVDADVSITGTGLSLAGVYADEASRDEVLAVADAIQGAEADGTSVAVELVARASATEQSAGALETDLNELVAESPILFEQASAAIDEDSSATLDRVAALAQRVGGVVVEIQGHTDTDGEPVNNQLLSELRAEAVLEALVDRGVPRDALRAAGFGGSQPVLDADGVEDKAASRRVEFLVALQ